MLLEERVPGLGIVTAGGLDEVCELFSHEGHSLSGMLNAAKGSKAPKISLRSGVFFGANPEWLTNLGGEDVGGRRRVVRARWVDCSP
jgi:hypothetical protein